MDMSKFFAKVLGIYFLIVSTSMLSNMPQFMIDVNNLINDAPLMFVTGFFTLILGIIMVVSHNIWQWNWRLLVTLLAWLTLLKGSSLISYPQLIDKMSLNFMQNTAVAYSSVMFDFVLGVILTYFGFKQEAKKNET